MRSKAWRYQEAEKPDRLYEEASKSLKVRKTERSSTEMSDKDLNLLGNKEIGEGRISLQGVIEDERKLYDLYKKLGQQYVLVGNHSSAIETFTKAINIAKEKKFSVIELYRSRSDSYSKQGNYQRSGKDLEEILKIDAEDLLAQKSLMDNFKRQNDLSSAFAFFQDLLDLSKKRLENKVSQMTTQFQEIFIDIADRFSDGNKLKRAESIFKKAIKLNPQNASVYNSMGNMYFNKKNFTNAAKLYKTALRFDPGFFYAEYNLGLIDEYNQRIASALNRYTKAAALSPDFESAYIRMAALYFSTQQYRKAKNIYERLLTLNNTNAFYYYGLGIIEESLGNWQASIKNYQKATRINPEHEDAYIRMAEIYYSRKNYHGAKGMYTKLTNLFPKKEINFYSLGIVEELLQNNDAALECFLTAVKLNSGYWLALNKIASIYFHKGDYQNAKAVYKKLIAINERDPSAYYDMGLIEESQQNWTAAIENYQIAIKLNPDLEDALYNIAEIHFNNKNFEEAKKIYRKLIRKRPESKDYSNIGLIEEHQQKWDAAIRNYRNALELNQHSSSALSGLARVYYDKGDYKSSKEMYLRLVAIEPENNDGYYFLGVIEQEFKKWDKAIEYFNKAINLQPTRAAYYAVLGDLYDEMGKKNEAVMQFLLALKHDADNAFYHSLLGFVYTRYKERSTYQRKAVKEFQECIRLDPHYRYPYAALAGCYRRMGNEEEFSKYSRKVKEMKSDPNEEEYVQASTEALCGNPDEAVRLLKIAFDKGQRSPQYAANDPDFEYVRDKPEFKVLAEIV